MKRTKKAACLSLCLNFFFFFLSNPHNPEAVICRCSVICGKASPSLCSSICTSSLHPALTLLIFPVICYRAHVWLVVLLFVFTLWHHPPACTCVCLCAHVVPPLSGYLGLKARTIPTPLPHGTWINECRYLCHHQTIRQQHEPPLQLQVFFFYVDYLSVTTWKSGQIFKLKLN